MDVNLVVGFLLLAALGFAVYMYVPIPRISEPFTVFDPADREHHKILPPNPGLGSLEPTLLPLDKQNADVRGEHALLRHGKGQGVPSKLMAASLVGAFDL